ncbi:MAG: cytidyltransferase [Betaproteobacteria bacterium]
MKNSHDKLKYSLFIGRWQPWHEGHRWLIDQRLHEGKNVCVAIRDVAITPREPWTAEEVKENIEKELSDLIKWERVKVIIIPDIESVNYGRGVGYEIIEHFPPEDVKKISATEIRSKMK